LVFGEGVEPDGTGMVCSNGSREQQHISAEKKDTLCRDMDISIRDKQ
jgi:hypothetical protein